jgi:putative transposase
MPRSPRIEFEGAVYHVMARGNRREPIVFNDSDRDMFVKTLGEAATKAGFEVFAWVLLDNHYHAVLRTPHGNLVEGMRWFQNTFTRRINSRHRLWGHVFGGRYRSILIENEDFGGAVWRDYLRTAIDYVHLNPGRAGVVDGGAITVESYQWSSLAQAYGKSPTKRPDWMAVAETMDLFQNKDTAAGRRKFLERLNQWVREEKGIPPVDEETIGERVKRGWFWGTDSFKEAMLVLYDTQVKTKSLKGNRVHQSSGLLKDHAEVSAEAILEAAVGHFGATRDELKIPIRGDMVRAAVANRIHENTTVSQSWIANVLGMKSAANVSRQIYVFRKIDENTLAPKIRKWIKIKNF